MPEEHAMANFTGCKIYGSHIEHYFEAKENDIVFGEKEKGVYTFKHNIRGDLLDIITIVHKLVVQEFSFESDVDGYYSIYAELYVNGKSQLKMEFITTKGNELFITGVLSCITAVLINLTNQTGFRFDFITHNFDDFRTYYDTSISYGRKRWNPGNNNNVFTAIGIRIDMPEHLKHLPNEEILIHIECDHRPISRGTVSLYYEMINGYISGHKGLTCVASQDANGKAVVYLFDGSMEYDYDFPVEVDVLNVEEVSSVLYDDPWSFVQEVCYYD